MNEAVVEQASERLNGLAAMLAADGYRLVVSPDAHGIAVAIEAGSDACADCLSPEWIVRQIIDDELAGLVEVTSLVYPAASAAGH
jgi:hypothetical protein